MTPGSEGAGGLAPGATGRMETDAAGNRVFVTADGVRIPMGGGHVTLAAADGEPRTGQSVAMADGSRVVVGVSPADAAVHTGGIAPGPGLQASLAEPVMVAPSGRLASPPAREAASAPALSTRVISAGDAIEVRSEEIQELISRVPHWVVRWGTLVFCLTVAALLWLTWLVRYPDLVEGRVTLTTPARPVRIVARTSGELQGVLVGDNARVLGGAALAVVRNPADYRDVFALSRRLAAMGPGLSGTGAVRPERFDPTLALGELQPGYSELMRRLEEYEAFRGGSYYPEKISATQRELGDHGALEGRLRAQQEILLQQLQLAERKHARSRLLAGEQMMTADELEKSEAEYLQARYAVRTGESAITSNDIQGTSARQSLLDLRQKYVDEERQQRAGLRTAYEALRADLNKWEQAYVLRAPVAGRVSFFEAVGVDQFVEAAQPLMAIVPESQAVVGTQLLPESRAGKVRVGQRVIIRIDSYPAEEFGTVEGRVQQISLLANPDPSDKEPGDAKYLVRVSFPRGLVTSSGRRLPLRQEMRGTGAVVTDDLRLAERIFHQFLAAAAGR